MQRVTVLLLALLAGFATACRKPAEFVAPPPPEVTVTTPESRTITETIEFTGTTEPYNTVEIRARVRGFVQEVTFEEGTVVEEGDVLFKIDPSEFQAQYDLALAEVASRKADLALAEATLKRLERAATAVAEIQIIEARAKRDVAAAAVDAAEAEAKVKQLDVGYTIVKAPIRGRIADAPIRIGTLVGATEPTLLTTIVDDSKIYAYFNVSDRDLLKAREKRGPDPDRRTGEALDVPVRLALETDEGFPHEGVIDYVDPEVDAETGTLRARAEFDNPDGVLFPGLFVRLELALGEKPGSLLVPEVAIGADQTGRYLLLVGKNDIVKQQNITLGSRQGPLRVIDSGVSASDRVIVSGLQRARPGAPVRPVAQGELPDPAGSEKRAGA